MWLRRRPPSSPLLRRPALPRRATARSASSASSASTLHCDSDGDVNTAAARPVVRAWNSLSGRVEPLPSRSPLRWYACGPTVYDRAHLGHARAYVSQDVLRRVLERRFGVHVLLVMGVTDVDDKILRRAKEQNEPFLALARREERDFFRDMAALHVQAPAAVTRVSEHLEDIGAYVARLEDGGFAYAAPDGSGVYFDTQRLGDDYGKLDPSRRPKGVENGEPVEVEEDPEAIEPAAKRHPRDFALWKAPKAADEPQWLPPTERGHWGSGRPGWHIECSAMTHHVLGNRLDVHSGGVDLRFPHHNNEIAQCDAHRLSSSCGGGGSNSDDHGEWCQHFVHFGHLYISGRKMSKSLKNFISIRDFLAAHSADHFRLFCLQHRYRTNVTYSEDRVRDAAVVADRFRSFLRTVQALAVEQHAGDKQPSKRCEQDDIAMLDALFATRSRVDEALADDFDTPQALQLVLDLLAKAHTYFVARLDVPAEVLAALAGFALDVLDLFGLMDLHGEFAPRLASLQLAGSWATPASTGSTVVTEAVSEGGADSEQLLRSLVDFRARVREQALLNPKDPANARILQLCDSLRNEELLEMGVQVEDLAPGRSVFKQLSQDERAAAALAAEAQQRAKEEAAAERRARQLELDALMQISPLDFFRLAPEFAGQYDAFDADGLPTCDAATGEPLTKSQRKKLAKKLAKHAAAFTKYWEARGEQPPTGSPEE